jgi:uncharacterized protein (DUF697 family)
MQNPLCVVSVDKAASEHAQNLASFIKELDIDAELWTLDEYKDMAGLSDSAYSEAKFIFIGKSAKACVPGLTVHYKRFGGSIGWIGGKCAISAKDANLPFSEYKEFLQYCKIMQLEHPDVSVPPGNPVQRVKNFSSDSNSAQRAQFSTLIHEFISSYLICFLSEQSSEAPEQYKGLLSKIKSIALSNLTWPQRAACNAIIHAAAAGSAACAFLPLPFVDALPITLLQIVMVISLGKAFHNELDKSDARALVETMMAPLVGKQLSKIALIFIPGVGWAINGAVAATITEILGWSVANDFAMKGKR